MTDTTQEARAACEARHEVILAEVAQEEAEAVEHIPPPPVVGVAAITAAMDFAGRAWH